MPSKFKFYTSERAKLTCKKSNARESFQLKLNRLRVDGEIHLRREITRTTSQQTSVAQGESAAHKILGSSALQKFIIPSSVVATVVGSSGAADGVMPLSFRPMNVLLNLSLT